MSVVPSIIVLMITALIVFRREITAWPARGGNKGILAAQEMLDSAFRQNFDDIVPRI